MNEHGNNELRQMVVDAAAECYSQIGVKKTTFALIAEKAGVTPDQVKSLFRNKNLLALAVQSQEIERLQREYLANMPDATLEETIKFIIRSRCDFVQKNQEQTQHFFHRALAGKQPWSTILDQLIWQLSIEFAALMEKAVRQGVIRSDVDINIAVRSITSFYLIGIVSKGLRAKEFDADEVWNFMEPQIDMLLAGIKA